MGATQLYIPEAVSPSLWIGRIQGHAHLSAEQPSQAVELTFAVSKPGAYSLARGLQITTDVVKKNISIQSLKLEFTLVVENKDL